VSGSNLGDVIALSDPESLVVLRQELEEALAAIEIRERVLAETMQPRTLAEIEELERRLTDALEELQARKVTFEEKEPTQD
jgi:hypothetical protein